MAADEHPADSEGAPPSLGKMGAFRVPAEGAVKERVLVADDLEFNRMLLRGVLEQDGYEVLEAENGVVANRLAREAHPGLILLDVNMPGIDGYETCSVLRLGSETRNIPVIFITARTSTEDVVKGFKAGAVDYVGKPFQPEELLARVRTHLELRRAREEIQELRNLVPVCAWCRKIRNDEGGWETIEQYIQEHGGSKVSHGICPDCIGRLSK